MPSEPIVSAINALGLQPNTGAGRLASLTLDGYFDTPQPSEAVVKRIAERYSERWQTKEIQPFAVKLIRANVLQAVKTDKSRTNYWVVRDVARDEAVRMIAKGKRLVELEHQLFSAALIQKLRRNFEIELAELHDNFGTNGNASAFLLRKTLEKLLIIVFGKIGKASAVEDSKRPGGYKGLQEIIDVATREKINGLPLLTGKTANELRGVKFLGDAAAHNPLTNVEMNTIVPQMPYLITAYQELALHL